MKRLFLPLFALAFLFAFAVPAFSGDYNHEEAKLKITIPDTWKVEEEEGLFVASSPDGEAAVVLTMIEAEGVEAGIKAAVEQIETQYKDLKYDDPVETKINGLDVWGFDGSGLLKETNSKCSFSIALIVSPSGKIMFFHCVISENVKDKYDKDVDKIIESIKPL